MRTKTIIISKKAVMQYILLYIAAHMTGSYFYNTNSEIIKYIVCLITLALMSLKYIKLRNEIYIFVGVIFAGMMLSRFLNGGVGLGSLLDYICPFLIMYCAYYIDKDMLCTRYVRFTALFAGMSTLFWLLAVVNFNVFKNLMGLISIKYVYSVGLECYDSFFYSLMPDNFFANPRNDSFFSEPAQFSIMLNSAVWLIIFAREQLHLRKKQVYRIMVIITIALITSQSTTAYICFGFLLIGLMVMKRDYIKNKFVRIALVVAGLLIIDLAIRGKSSFLSTSILSKVIDSSGAFSLAAETGTGKYRISALETGLSLFLSRPLGWGVDYVDYYIDLYSFYGMGSAGGGFAIELARYGFIVVGFFVGWMIWRIKKNKVPTIAIICFFLYYFWTVMAQAYITYPLLFIPLFTDYNERREQTLNKKL